MFSVFSAPSVWPWGLVTQMSRAIQAATAARGQRGVSLVEIRRLRSAGWTPQQVLEQYRVRDSHVAWAAGITTGHVQRLRAKGKLSYAEILVGEYSHRRHPGFSPPAKPPLAPRARHAAEAGQRRPPPSRKKYKRSDEKVATRAGISVYWLLELRLRGFSDEEVISRRARGAWLPESASCPPSSRRSGISPQSRKEQAVYPRTAKQVATESGYSEDHVAKLRARGIDDDEIVWEGRRKGLPPRLPPRTWARGFPKPPPVEDPTRDIYIERIWTVHAGGALLAAAIVVSPKKTMLGMRCLGLARLPDCTLDLPQNPKQSCTDIVRNVGGLMQSLAYSYEGLLRTASVRRTLVSSTTQVQLVFDWIQQE